MLGEFFVENIYFVPLIPLWIFLLIVLGRFLNIIQSRRVISTITLLSTFLGCIFSFGAMSVFLKTPDYVYQNVISFINISNFSIDLGIYVDNLSILMLCLLTSISLVVQIYSVNYMWKDKSFPRFFGYLNLFNFSMAGLVLSPNLFQNYIFWELVGASSYLLIGFWYKKSAASNAARKAFIINRIGDFCLLAGTIGLSYFMYQYSGEISLAAVPFDNIFDVGNYFYTYTNVFVFNVICVLLLMGAVAKSAQFPLHTWLPDAMEGPTPVSALIHSATMVAAGVYLVARLYPIFSLDPFVMKIITIIGCFTALLGAFIAITQTDLKRILAFSTCSQLGLMFMALGLGAFTGGIFHLVTHAYLKAMLFLCSGIVINSLISQHDIRYMGGVRKFIPFTAICYFFGCLSAAGICFGGFNSKEMIFYYILNNNCYIYAVIFLLIAFMTSFYLFRSYFLVFEGRYRGSCVPQKTNIVLNSSVGFLLIVSIMVTFVGNSQMHSYLLVTEKMPQMNYFYTSILLIASVLGFVFAYIFYNTKYCAVKISMLYKLSYNKCYFDEIYSLFTKFFTFLCRAGSFIDKYIIEGFVLLWVFIVRASSWILSKMQTGNFQSYITYSIVTLALIFSALMLAYTIIVQYSLLGGGV